MSLLKRPGGNRRGVEEKQERNEEIHRLACQTEMTYEQIGEQFGITRARANQIALRIAKRRIAAGLPAEV